MDHLSDLAPVVRRHLRDLTAVAVAGILIVGSILALAIGQVDLGITLRVDGDRVVIREVRLGSVGAREGYTPGMLVLSMNGVTLVHPGYLEQATPGEPTADPTLTPTAAPSAAASAGAIQPDASAFPSGDPQGPSASGIASPAPSSGAAAPIQPIVPTPTPTPTPTPRPATVPWGPGYLEDLITQPIWQLDATLPDAALGERSFNVQVYLGHDYQRDLGDSAYLLVAGLLILTLGGWLLATGRAGAELRPLALPVAAAAAIPFLARPIEATWAAPGLVVLGLLVPLGIAPLGLALADLIRERGGRVAARTAAIASAGLALLVAFALPGAMGRAAERSSPVDVLWVLLAGGAALVPGLLASLRPAGSVATGRGVLQSNALAAVAVTPMASLATGLNSLPLFLPLSAWLIAIAVANRWTIRPLARVAARASLQRDLVVAATEAERARVAAEIHDDALQELTLLVRRLDDTGDAESAEIARNVSDRLRAICGDLRLPVLDDLGVGPALDWLAERMQRLAGGPVILERTGDARLPPDVELAFFRIAQEAVGNAVKHGKPPITIRFHATTAGASLAVDDVGPGIDPKAGERADQAAAAAAALAAASAEAGDGATDAGEPASEPGRFGILNMQQRAEQIGALLDIRPWPGGGTHVALEWRAS